MFDRINIQLFALAIGMLIIGYVCLGQGPYTNPVSMTVAPIILVFTYCVLIPLAIMYKPKKKE